MMNGNNSFYRLYFNNHFIFNDQVRSETVIKFNIIPNDRNSLLPFYFQSPIN